MDDFYDEKQHCRKKELNSQRNSHHINDQKHKKTRELGHDMIEEFHPANSRRSFPCTKIPSYDSQISMISDDGMNDYLEYQETIAQGNSNYIFSPTTLETSINPVPDIADLAHWIRTHKELVITPINECHKNHDSMKDKCRKAEPIVDPTILDDLRRAFDNPPFLQLYKTIYCCSSLPFCISSDTGELNTKASEFMLDYKLTKKQLYRINDICRQIIHRSSYGVLFLRDNKFFAKITQSTRRNRSAIKAYSKLKLNGEWEHPWETAVDITKQDIEYRNSENEEWKSFDMDEHIKVDERQTYLECLIRSARKTSLIRYLGLFIIRLKSNIQIRITDPTEVDISNGNWYPMDMEMEYEVEKFYTIHPFLQYLREHPDLA